MQRLSPPLVETNTSEPSAASFLSAQGTATAATATATAASRAAARLQPTPAHHHTTATSGMPSSTWGRTIVAAAIAAAAITVAMTKDLVPAVERAAYTSAAMATENRHTNSDSDSHAPA